MASINSTFRPDHDVDETRERDAERDDDVALGRRALTRYLTTPHGDGRPLPGSIASSLEATLGQSLADVRVYDDARAARMVRSVNAAGLTYGRRIYLAGGANADTLAHEAAHAAQHRGAQPTEVRYGGDAAHEEFADRAAAMRHVPGEQVRVPYAAPRVRFRNENISNDEIVGHIASAMGKDKAKAGSMLRKASSEGRSQVEAAVRRNFSVDDAKEIIQANPPGNAAAPKVKGADAATSQTTGKTNGGAAKSGKHAGGKGKGGGAGGKKSAKGATPPAKEPAKPAPPEKDPDLASTSNDGLALIQQELTAHEEWKGELAKAKEETKVGDAGSYDRAAFIADSAGKGFATGAATGVLTTVVGTGITKGLEYGATKIVGKEVPGIGPLLAGGMSAYALATKDWKESGAKIGAIGQGADGYEKIANTLAGIGEILDIAVNIMNVFAGLLVVAAGVMWLITILTVGVATPLAAACTSLAAGIVAVTTILDMINRGVIQPLVLVFRAMHAFTSQADPRDVAEMGDGISEAASDAASFFAAKATEGAMGAVGGKKEDAPDLDAKTKGGTGESAKTPTSEGSPHEPAPHEPAPHEPEPTPKSEAKPEEPHEKAPEENKKTPEEQKAENDAKKAEDQKQAKEKIDAAEKAKEEIDKRKTKVEDEREKLGDEKKEKIEKAREEASEKAREKADEEAKAKREESDRKLEDKLDEIDKQAAEDEKALEAKHAEQEKAIKDSVEADKQAAHAEAEQKANAAKSDAEGRRDAAKQANAEKAQKAIDADEKPFRAEEQKLDAEYAAEKAQLEGIEDEKIRSEELAKAEQSHSESKRQLEAQKEAAKKTATDQANAKRVQADADADAKFQTEQEKIEARAEQAKAKADLEADKKIEQAKTRAAQETAAQEKAVERQKEAAREANENEKAAADKKANADVKTATDEAGKKEAAKLAAEAKKLRKEDWKLDAEQREAEEAVQKAKAKAAQVGAYDPTRADKWDAAKEKAGNDVDLSLLKGTIEKKAVKPAMEGAGLVTKGEEKKEEKKDKQAPWTEFHKGFEEGPKKARVMLPDPPGTLQQLEEIKEKIAKDLKARGVYASHETANAATEQDEKHSSDELKKADAKGKEAQDAAKGHKGKVDEKEAAIDQQKAKNTDAGRTIAERSQRMAGITAVTIPLGVVTGLAHLVGGIWKGAETFARDGDKLLAQFAAISKNLGDSQKNTEESGKKLDADKRTNDQTKQKAAQTDQTLQKSQQGVKTLDQKISKNATTAGAEKQKANAGKTQADANAKKGQGEYKALMAQLTAWAQNHKALRTASKQGGEDKHE